MIEVTDDLSRTIRLDSPARRIVCLVPSITETLFALGAGPAVVGITDFCIHPQEEVRTRAKVGGTKNFDTERVLDLGPDLVIANAEENRRHQIERLEQAGLKVFVTFPRTIDGCMKMIADMASLTGGAGPARRLLESIENARSEALASAMSPPRRVLCPIWKNPYMTINRDTFVDSVIRGCGGRNIFEDGVDRYPQFTLEEAARRSPEVVLLPTEPYHFTEDDFPGFEEMGKGVPAVRNHHIHIVEGELLSWYGPRLPRALSVISRVMSTE